MATKHEILDSLKKPADSIPAIVALDGAKVVSYDVPGPVRREPNFPVTGVNDDFTGLSARAAMPG